MCPDIPNIKYYGCPNKETDPDDNLEAFCLNHAAPTTSWNKVELRACIGGDQSRATISLLTSETA